MRKEMIYTTRRGNGAGNGGWRAACGRTSGGWTSRRGGAAGTTGSWARNYNTVRHTPKMIGSISNLAIVCLLVLIVGLIYVAQGTQATNYDYQLSAVNDEIAELTAKKEDLAVERARLTSVAAAEKSTVAANMEVASVAGYAEE